MCAHDCVCLCTYACVVCAGVATTHSPFPRAVAVDDSGIRDLVPESGILHRVDSLLRINVQVDTLHDTAERCSETKGEMSVLHTPENKVKRKGMVEGGRYRERE